MAVQANKKLTTAQLDRRYRGEREVGNEGVHVGLERVHPPPLTVIELLRELARLVIDTVSEVLPDEGHHPNPSMNWQPYKDVVEKPETAYVSITEDQA